MRRLRGHEIAIGALVATAFWALILVLTSDAASHYEICEPTKEAAKQAAKNCASYNIISFALLEIGAHLDIIGALITAAATAFIARYTFTLKQSTDRLWKAGEKQFGLARDDFNATHRPWLPITKVTPGFGLNWAVRNAVVGFSVSCKNTGNSPAQRVSLAARIFPFLTEDVVPLEIAKLKKTFPSHGVSRELIEHTLFPEISGEFELSTALIIPEASIAGLKDYFGDPATEMVPVIIGFIKYYFSFGEVVPHYTPFVYHLWRTDASGHARITFKLDGSNVDANEMILIPLLNAGDPT